MSYSFLYSFNAFTCMCIIIHLGEFKNLQIISYKFVEYSAVDLHLIL